MAGSTPVLHLPYPSPPDPADVPADMQALAMAIDALKFDGLVALGSRATNVASPGSTFAAGVDVLATALSFTADGTSRYLVTVTCSQWINAGGGGQNNLALVLDGAQAGLLAAASLNTLQGSWPAAGAKVIQPAAGSHTVNARFWATATSAVMIGGDGTAGNNVPILVTVRRLAS